MNNTEHHCNHDIVTVTLVAIFFLTQSGIAHPEDTRSLKEQVLSDAPSVWSESYKSSINIELKLNTTDTDRSEGKEWIERKEIVIKSRDGMLLREVERLPAEGDLPETLRNKNYVQFQLEVVNSQRYYVLSRSGEAPWSVKRAGPSDDKWAQSFKREGGRIYVLWPWFIADWYLPKLFQTPGFHVDSVEPVRNADRTFAKVVFSFAPEKTAEPNYLRGGWMMLDPDRNWSIKQYEAQLEYPNGEHATTTGMNEYRDGNDAIPAKSTITLNEGQPKGIRATIEFLQYERHLVPPSEFTMAAYGIDMAHEQLDVRGTVGDFAGKELPKFQVTDTSGVSKDVQLSDYRGKWVLIDFWGPSCPSCLRESIPKLTRFYDEHRSDQGRFAILSICVISDKDGSRTLADLNRQMQPIVDKLWNGRPLPYPILLDADGSTFEQYKIVSVPCCLLVDPNGRLVDGNAMNVLAEQLRQEK